MNDEQKKPAEQGKNGLSSRSGTAPPPQHRWPPGVSGNPAGRASIGLSVIGWMNQLRESTQDDLEAIMQDRSAPSNKAIAARCVLDARSTKVSKAGVPIAGAELDRLIDRTNGRPVSTAVIETTDRSVTSGTFSRLGKERLREVVEMLLDDLEILESREAIIDVPQTTTPAQLPENEDL